MQTPDSGNSRILGPCSTVWKEGLGSEWTCPCSPRDLFPSREEQGYRKAERGIHFFGGGALDY